MSHDPAGETRNGAGPRLDILDLSGRVRDGIFYSQLIFSRNLHAAAQMERLSDQFIEALRTLISTPG